jgi:hypothetical protein
MNNPEGKNISLRKIHYQNKKLIIIRELFYTQIAVSFYKISNFYL